MSQASKSLVNSEQKEYGGFQFNKPLLSAYNASIVLGCLMTVHHDLLLPSNKFLAEGELKSSLLHWSPATTIFSTGSKRDFKYRKRKTMSLLYIEPLPAGRWFFFSFLEWGEFIEGMPKKRWLSLRFCQSKNLLLRNAGRYGDVALVNRM